jgi:toxin ParE1/3/4
MVPGARTYHLSFSRSLTGRPGVKKPRHFILYRSASTSFLEIARILHDSSDLNRHLPEGYQHSPEEAL